MAHEADAAFRTSDDTRVADTAVVSAAGDEETTTGEITPGFTVLGALVGIAGLIGLARSRG